MSRTKTEALAMQEELRLRELKIVAEEEMFRGKLNLEQAQAIIVADRLDRWADVVAAIEVPAALQKWAARMEAVYGPQVLMHERPNLRGYKTDWITALLIVRYGESEYFWPDGFGKDDMRRALAWMQGKKTPPMITYLPKEG